MNQQHDEDGMAYRVAQYEAIERDYLTYFKQMQSSQYFNINDFSMPEILLKMRDGEDYSEIIWEAVT